MRIIEGGVEIETTNIIEGGVPSVPSVCNLITTGQTTSHHANDDGDLELGIAHNYQVLTTGQYSGTTNIVINGKTHALSNNCVLDHAVRRNGKPVIWARYVPLADIGPAADGLLFWDQWTLASESCTFDAAAKTITAAAGTPFSTGALCAGRKIDLTGTVNNNKEVTVTNITSSVITVSESLTNEGPVNTTFATKDDLIWSLREQARTNGLGGYDDWELPNRRELAGIMALGVGSPCIDTSAFPSTPTNEHWTSSTHPTANTYAFAVAFHHGYTTGKLKKTAKYYCRLVRS